MKKLINRKSFTMLGPNDSVFELNSPNHGLIPRIINSIFDNNKNKAFIIDPEDDLDDYQNMKFLLKIFLNAINY